MSGIPDQIAALRSVLDAARSAGRSGELWSGRMDLSVAGALSVLDALEAEPDYRAELAELRAQVRYLADRYAEIGAGDPGEGHLGLLDASEEAKRLRDLGEFGEIPRQRGRE